MKKDIIIVSPEISEDILQNYVFLDESLVRPIKDNNAKQVGDILTGIILKLPVNKLSCLNRYLPGDEWKQALEQHIDFNVGDKVLYYNKSNITIDNECLHLVGWFTGKLLS